MTTPTDDQKRGRGYAWAGIALAVLGPVLFGGQLYGLRHLTTP